MERNKESMMQWEESGMKSMGKETKPHSYYYLFTIHKSTCFAP